MVFMLNVHVQTLRHLGMVTFNSSSVEYTRPFIHLLMSMSTLWGCQPVRSAPHTHLATSLCTTCYLTKGENGLPMVLLYCSMMSPITYV